ncbi:zinc finger CCHC domain-containing 4 [Brachionus plicatilis]|uniref:Zinc finger CCHC domain-containing 4 n=1 Tax=Brachionus plicatilis TaxID=10195 RepID=A0A3M7PLR0_BRAPC|nr:zinc finger CCHC domain-containing 4 [Brachionus plicatilis]
MSSNYDVIDLENINQNPYCNHGPTILFKNKDKLFYACSACRDHKLCNFYLKYEEGKKISQEKYDFWLDQFKSTLIPIEDQNKKRKEIINSKNKRYCHNCNEFILNSESLKKHSDHFVLEKITDEMLKKPLQNILNPIEKNSSNAQFVFDDQTNLFIQNHIKKFEYDSVLCIGTPSIFENLIDSNINLMLLDIDDRFMMFYDENRYQKFNMFNNYFFYDKKKYELFLAKAKNLLVIIDPPYGGMVKLISNTINTIMKDKEDGNFSSPMGIRKNFPQALKIFYYD